MDIAKLVKKHLKAGRFLQVATTDGDKPWVCTVHYVCDDALNVYWISEKSRRHSQEIAKNANTAAAVNLKGRPEDPLIGLQMEGVTGVVEDLEEKKAVLQLFVERHGSKQEWVDMILAGEGGREIYVLAPSFFAVFDTQSIKGDPRVEWRP